MRSESMETPSAQLGVLTLTSAVSDNCSGSQLPADAVSLSHGGHAAPLMTSRRLLDGVSRGSSLEVHLDPSKVSTEGVDCNLRNGPGISL
mmetsp:Transcript_68922/g.114177  ORF Transcript_68922/g.114177 Transcript_68922/m.114177 type:complete len:90 (+) Transcript_68922:942-1211(+)